MRAAPERREGARDGASAVGVEAVAARVRIRGYPPAFLLPLASLRRDIERLAS